MVEKKIPAGYNVISEGQARILYKENRLAPDADNMIKTNKGKRKANDQNEVRGEVFYNKIQEFNRDISILTIREFAAQRRAEKEAKKREFEGIKILEALAATGLRSVRYLREIDDVQLLLANDIDPTATDLMKKNFEFNGIKPESFEGKYLPLAKRTVTTEDANDTMYMQRKAKRLFDVVDLDPYGTAVPFLDAAVQSIGDGGMLAVTCTDMAVLCARTPQVCFYKYGGSPLPKPYTHEMALRILMHTINSIANRYQRSIEPLLSLTVDYYVRVFVRVRDDPIGCHETISRLSNVHQCMRCEAFYLQRLGHSTDVEIGHNKHKDTGSQYQ